MEEVKEKAGEKDTADEEKEEEKKEEENKEEEKMKKKLMPPPLKQFHYPLKLHQLPLPMVNKNLPRKGRLGPGSNFICC